MSAEERNPSIFDGHGETSFLDARRLVRAGELAARAITDTEGEAFGALFRAIDDRLEAVARWVEDGRREVLSLRASWAQEPPTDPTGR